MKMSKILFDHLYPYQFMLEKNMWVLVSKFLILHMHKFQTELEAGLENDSITNLKSLNSKSVSYNYYLISG